MEDLVALASRIATEMAREISEIAGDPLALAVWIAGTAVAWVVVWKLELM